MKFTIKKNTILDALNNVTRALSQKITIPVLNGIKFDLTSEGLTLIASDSELTIQVVIEEVDIINIDRVGTTIIQSRSILDIIRKMPSDVLNFETSDNDVKIYTDTNEFNLACFDISEYPNFNIQTSQNFVKVPASEIKKAIELTSYAMSSAELRPLLTGTNILANGTNLILNTTDSYRLVKKVINLGDVVEEDVNITVPGRTILELGKILGDGEDEIQVHFFVNKMVLIYKNITVQSNLLSGSYPETSHFIPDAFAYIINLKSKAFYEAVDRASLISSNKDKNIVKINIKEKEMLISASEETRNAEEVISIDTNKFDKLEISISSRYLLDALRVIKEEDILLLLNSEDKPIIIKPVDDESLTELILPMQNF